MAYEKLLLALKDRNWGSGPRHCREKPSAAALLRLPIGVRLSRLLGFCLQGRSSGRHARAISHKLSTRNCAKTDQRSADDDHDKCERVRIPETPPHAAFAQPALVCLFIVAIGPMELITRSQRPPKFSRQGPPLDRNGLVKTFDDEFTNFSWFAEGVPNAAGEQRHMANQFRICGRAADRKQNARKQWRKADLR